MVTVDTRTPGVHHPVPASDDTRSRVTAPLRPAVDARSQDYTRANLRRFNCHWAAPRRANHATVAYRSTNRGILIHSAIPGRSQITCARNKQYVRSTGAQACVYGALPGGQLFILGTARSTVMCCPSVFVRPGSQFRRGRGGTPLRTDTAR